MLYWVPIEPIKERYSEQWYRWFPKEFDLRNIEYQTIDGARLTNKITEGSFLDVYDTHYWKSHQLATISRMFFDKLVKDGDWFLFGDLWFPGLEMLAYMRDATKINFKVAGLLHAGSYDKYDRLCEWGTEPWAQHMETGWFEIADLIFVATYFHKEMVSQRRKMDLNKIKVTGFPLFNDWHISKEPKKNLIVFPHRLDLEKQPELFHSLIVGLQARNKGYSMVDLDMVSKTDLYESKETNWYFKRTALLKNKDLYYEYLNSAKVSVSFALQETWGIAMQESVVSGCLPIVPDRLSYKEVFPSTFRYDDLEEAMEMVKMFMTRGDEYQIELANNRERILKKGREAVYNMLEGMEQISYLRRS